MGPEPPALKGHAGSTRTGRLLLPLLHTLHVAIGRIVGVARPQKVHAVSAE